MLGSQDYILNTYFLREPFSKLILLIEIKLCIQVFEGGRSKGKLLSIEIVCMKALGS